MHMKAAHGRQFRRDSLLNPLKQYTIQKDRCFNLCSYIYIAHGVARVFPTLVASDVVSEYISTRLNNSPAWLTRVWQAVFAVFVSSIALENVCYNAALWVLFGVCLEVLIWTGLGSGWLVLLLACLLVLSVVCGWLFGVRSWKRWRYQAAQKTAEVVPVRREEEEVVSSVWVSSDERVVPGM